MALAFLNPLVLQSPILDTRELPSFQSIPLPKSKLIAWDITQEHEPVVQLSIPSAPHDALEDSSMLLPSIDDCISILQKCRKSKNLLHASSTLMHIYGSGLDYHEDVGNYLVPTFVECGKFRNASQVFCRLEHRTEHSWTSLIQGSIVNNELNLAFTLFEEMQKDSVEPSKHTFVALVNGSARFKSLERGQELHADIAREGFDLFSYVGNALVDMYAKCGSLAEASDVHQTMVDRDVVSWTSLISGYTEQGFGEEALKCLHEMQVEGVNPNDVTFLCSLKACSTIGNLHMGQQIFTNLVIEEFETKPFIESALVDLYAKCGLLVEAQELFDTAEGRDTVSWNTLIAGYAEHGLGKEALKCLEKMGSEGFLPDTTTYACGLKACGSIGAIEKGRELHAGAIVKELESDVYVGSTLVGMYAKCGAIAEAQDVLQELPTRGVVTWTALIAGTAECGLPKEALESLRQMQADGVSSDVVAWSAVILSFVEQGENEEALALFSHMQEQGVAPNRVTYLSILKATGNLAAIHFGKSLHARISSVHGSTSKLMATAVIDMYGDCGSMEDADKVFNAMLVKDQVSWNAFIRGYARQGNSKAVFFLTERLKHSRMKVDGIAAINVLTVCGHAGMVEEGEVIFESLINFPNVQQQNIMVNLFCQAGQLDLVVAMLEIAPLEPDLVTWGTLLGACQKWCHINLGGCIFEVAMKAVGEEAVSFISLSNIFVDARHWSDE
ncbi:hypothetical protein GOP47_0001229 [Adiantum capillus-veneris]|uniref:Pentatricopeptide repeat-containing protein n=1 Tax=Adiantum capillus-veneris TaxID=13818 RepID=A0A9D4ZTU5_ADICA|nr:hypothetical protein GOP47_0001229 [Adiantum capillus-veneris]